MNDTYRTLIARLGLEGLFASDDPIPDDRETILRPAFAHRDARGAITNILARSGPQTEAHPACGFTHLAVIDSRAGSIRASHFHPFDEQLMFLVSGEYRALSRPHSYLAHLAEAHELRVAPGDLVYCPPRVEHAYLFTKDSVFLNINSVSRDPRDFDKHTIPCALAECFKETAA